MTTAFILVILDCQSEISKTTIFIVCCVLVKKLQRTKEIESLRDIGCSKLEWKGDPRQRIDKLSTLFTFASCVDSPFLKLREGWNWILKLSSGGPLSG